MCEGIIISWFRWLQIYRGCKHPQDFISPPFPRHYFPSLCQPQLSWATVSLHGSFACSDPRHSVKVWEPNTWLFQTAPFYPWSESGQRWKRPEEWGGTPSYSFVISDGNSNGSYCWQLCIQLPVGMQVVVVVAVVAVVIVVVIVTTLAALLMLPLLLLLLSSLLLLPL